jgi:hypothetical protein
MKISTGKLDLFADTMADYNGTVGFRDLRADNVVAYISPSLAGFQLSGAIVPSGGATGVLHQWSELFEDSIAETVLGRGHLLERARSTPPPPSKI